MNLDSILSFVEIYCSVIMFVLKLVCLVVCAQNCVPEQINVLMGRF